MKNLKISTELASAVLGKEVTKCSLINKPRNSINITYFEDKEDFNAICREWNIYEFIYKCKEWALKKGFKIYSSCKTSSISQDGFLLWISPGENNEIETIIKACEYILNKIKQ